MCTSDCANQDNKIVSLDGKVCVIECPQGTFLDNTTNQCTLCDFSCFSCVNTF